MKKRHRSSSSNTMTEVKQKLRTLNLHERTIIEDQYQFNLQDEDKDVSIFQYSSSVGHHIRIRLSPNECAVKLIIKAEKRNTEKIVKNMDFVYEDKNISFIELRPSTIRPLGTWYYGYYIIEFLD